MKRELQVTADESHTVVLPEMHVAYHSIHGGYAEKPACIYECRAGAVAEQA